MDPSERKVNSEALQAFVLLYSLRLETTEKIYKMRYVLCFIFMLHKVGNFEAKI